MAKANGEIQVLWAGNRVPVAILLDDAMPCRNPMWYEFPDQGHVAEVPNRFTESFIEMIERTGVTGKFSVVPCPGAQGRVDERMPGVPEEDLSEFLRMVRERIAPRWDISPELLTHNRAMDIATMQPLPEREDTWAARQDEATLTSYISLALQILRNAGLDPNGVTSPWALGAEIEETYNKAISKALHDVCGVNVGWYFLHADAKSPRVLPRVEILDIPNRVALTSLIGGSRPDVYWSTQHGEPADIDAQLTPDGSGGRFAELYSNGSPVVFYTHWQSLFSNGSGAGLEALGELCERINRVWGEGARWTSAQELAVYCATREATSFRWDASGCALSFEAPFECPDFTISLPVTNEARDLSFNGQPLEQLPQGATVLSEGTWTLAGDRAVVCFPLRDGVMLEWS